MGLKVCYACQTELPEGKRYCPACGRTQVRTCYCGNDIPVTAMRCPHCGADWSQSARVRRRKSHSRRPRPEEMVVYALGGAVVALALALLAGWLLEQLARQAVAPGESLPPGLGQRLYLAAQAAGAALGAAARFIITTLSSLLELVIVVAVGAGGGVLVYLARTRWRRGHHLRRTSGQEGAVVRVRRRRA